MIFLSIKDEIDRSSVKGDFNETIAKRPDRFIACCCFSLMRRLRRWSAGETRYVSYNKYATK
jgi:hypothetical protein